MNQKSGGAAFLLIGLSLLPPPADAYSNRTVWDLAGEEPDCSVAASFIELVNVGAAETLDDPAANITLFIPTNQAFKSFKDKLTAQDASHEELVIFSNQTAGTAFLRSYAVAFLLYNLAWGGHRYDLLQRDAAVETLLAQVLHNSTYKIQAKVAATFVPSSGNGSNIYLVPSSLYGRELPMIQRTLQGSNGVLHIIDGMLLPWPVASGERQLQGNTRPGPDDIAQTLLGVQGLPLRLSLEVTKGLVSLDQAPANAAADGSSGSDDGDGGRSTAGAPTSSEASVSVTISGVKGDGGSTDDGTRTVWIAAVAGVASGCLLMLILGMLAAGLGWRYWRRRQSGRGPCCNQHSSGDSESGWITGTPPLVTKRTGSTLLTPCESFRTLLSNNSWSLDQSELQFVRKIGSGAFGSVYLGKLRGAPVAIKCLHEHHLAVGNNTVSGRHTRALAREIELMLEVRSPFVVLFLGVCLNPLSCVTEYCAKGSLYDVLHQARGDPELASRLGWDKRLKMALHAALGMQAIHSMGLLHRDLKTPNLLVDESLRVKVGDFGLCVLSNNDALAAPSSVTDAMGNDLVAAVIDDARGISGSGAHGSGSSSSHTGVVDVGSGDGGDGSTSSLSSVLHLNRRWLAPEVAQALVAEDEGPLPRRQQQQQPFTTASDVYSYGLVLWELATWHVPFHKLSDPQVLILNSQGKLRPSVPKPEELVGGEFPGLEQYLQLMRDCWAEEPTDRPAFDEITHRVRDVLRTYLCANMHSSTGTASPTTVATDTAPTNPSGKGPGHGVIISGGGGIGCNSNSSSSVEGMPLRNNSGNSEVTASSSI